MDYNSGIFKCKFCGSEEIEGFKKWISRKEFVNDNVLKTKYIFYKSKSSTKEFKCSLSEYTNWIFIDYFDNYECQCYDCLHIFVTFLECLYWFFLFIIYPVFVIYYLAIGIWIDFIIFKCCSSKIYEGLIESTNIEANNDKELWNKVTNYTEEEINNKYNYKFKCSNCKYKFNSFFECFPGFKKPEIKTDKVNDSAINIAVNFSSNDQKINFPIPCMERDVFKNIENKLYKEYPEYRKKNCFFLVNGRKIEEARTIESNRIKNGDNIIICSNS